MAIITDLKDPRISDVTVTLVEVSPDMRQAKVNVSVMGDQTKQNLCLRGLQNSAGFLQQKIGKRIDTRYTPRLQFVLDKGLKHALTVTRILEEVLPQEDSSEAEDTAPADSGPGAATSDSGNADTADTSETPDHAPPPPDGLEPSSQPADHLEDHR